MSARALTWAWQQHPATATQKLVLAAMADRADEDGVCYPKTSWIADKCAPMSVRTVRWAIGELVKQGLVVKLERVRRGDGTFSAWVYELAITSGNPLSLDTPNQLQPIVTQEPSKEHVSTDVLTQDDLWDACEEHVQKAPAAKSPRAAYAKLVREMFAVGVTPDDVRRRAKRYRKRFPAMELTVAALAKWGEELDRGKRSLTEDGSSRGESHGVRICEPSSVSELPHEENARRMRELAARVGVLVGGEPPNGTMADGNSATSPPTSTPPPSPVRARAGEPSSARSPGSPAAPKDGEDG